MVDSKIIKKDCRKIIFVEEDKIREDMAKMMIMSLADWSRADIDEIRERWAKRKLEIEEVEKKKVEREKRIQELKKRKEKKRKKVIRERRCFVCGIFGHMAHYCRNRGEDKGLVCVPSNKFEVLRDRVMQREEGSKREVGKDRKEILREERAKKKKTKVEKKERKEKKKEKMREVEEKIEEERELEMQDFSSGEILRERYSLV